MELTKKHIKRIEELDFTDYFSLPDPEACKRYVLFMCTNIAKYEEGTVLTNHDVVILSSKCKDASQVIRAFAKNISGSLRVNDEIYTVMKKYGYKFTLNK
jgi:hypothetical protein